MAKYYAGNNPPFAHWRNLPIYLATIVTASFALGLVLCAVAGAGQFSIVRALTFEMPLRPAWSLWRLVTYVFVNPVNFFTPFAIAFFYWMAVGVETHLGRGYLARLMILLVLTVPAVAALWWWGLGVNSVVGGQGDYIFFSGMLVAFAALYPNSEWWGWIPFKWVAFACIVCGSLMILAETNWVALSQLWASCVVGFAVTRQAIEHQHDDYESPLVRLQRWFRGPKFRVLPKPAAAPVESRRPVRSAPEDGLAAEMDALLDKIAKTGMASLTTRERSRLEKAREALLKKERH